MNAASLPTDTGPQDGATIESRARNLLAAFADWQAERTELSENDGPGTDPDDWHASDDDAVAMLRAFAELAGDVVRGAEEPGEEFLAAIYVPAPEKPGPDDAVDARLVCPHCGEDEDVVEVDSAIRWNTLSGGDAKSAHFYTGDNYDFEGDGFYCPTCSRELGTPDAFMASDFSVWYD